MEKVFKFVKGGWLAVIIICTAFIIYTLIRYGITEDVYLSVVFIVFGGVMYYLNVRRVKMYAADSKKKKHK